MTDLDDSTTEQVLMCIQNHRLFDAVKLVMDNAHVDIKTASIKVKHLREEYGI